MALQYRAYNWVGKQVSGVLDTDSEEAAYDMLERDGLIPYRIQPVGGGRRWSFHRLIPILFKPKSQELIGYTTELASLLRSGIPLREALVVTRDGSRSIGFREALRRVVARIEEGERFSDACASVPWVFPSYYIRILRVAEATGSLAPTLQNLGESLEKEKRVRDRVRRALTYPAIAMVVAAGAGTILLTYALPALLGFLEEFAGEELPFTTRALIAVRGVLAAYGVAIIGGILGATAAFLIALRTRRGVEVKDRVLLKLPVIGKTLLMKNTFSIASTMTTLLRNGVPPMDAIQLAEHSVKNSVILRALEEVAEDVSQGTRLAEAFQNQTIFPSLLSQAIVTGEMGGNLRDTLAGVAEYYENETEKSVASATELIQPAIILIVAGVVGFVAVGIISGIYSSLGAVR